MKDKTFPMAAWSLTPIALDDSVDNLPKGEAIFDGKRGVTLDLSFGKLVDTAEQTEFGWIDSGEPKHLDRIYGYTQQGQSLVLNNVTAYSPGISIPGKERQRIDAHSIEVTSLSPANPNPRVSKVHLTCPGLREWTCGSPAKTRTMFFKDERRTVINFSYDTNDAPPLLLYEDEYAGVSIIRNGVVPSHRVGSLDFVFEYHCVLEITFKQSNPHLKDAISEWAVSLWNYLSFCMGLRPSIESIRFFDVDSDTWGDYYAPFTGRNTEYRPEELGKMPLTYEALGTIEGNTYAAWRALDGDAERAATVLVGLLDEWTIPISLVFTACAGALEAASRSGRKTEEFSQEVLSERLSEINDSALSNRTKKWARRRLKYANKKDAGELLNNALDEIGDYVKYLIPNIEQFKKEHRYNRNKYTHLDALEETISLKGENLFIHTWATWLVCYGLIARLLKIEPSFLIERLKQSRFLSGRVLDAQRLHKVTTTNVEE